jgi:hypothetical protein
MNGLRFRKGRRKGGAKAALVRTLPLALVGAAALFSSTVTADVTPVGQPVLTASGETAPTHLPRTHAASIALRAGFTSEVPGSSTTPELERVAIELNPAVEFQTAGLPSCPLSEVASPTEDPRQTCAESLVGHGTVDSEITLWGQAPARVEGTLHAFYAFAEGVPRILARVTTGEPLSLVYVIPFEIHQADRAFGTRLIVRKMHTVHGRCLVNRQNCFAQPYRLTGVYGHISKLNLSLHRAFAHAGHRTSFVTAKCPLPRAPAPRNPPEPTFPFVRATAHYTDQSSMQSTESTVLRRAC